MKPPGRLTRYSISVIVIAFCILGVLLIPGHSGVGPVTVGSPPAADAVGASVSARHIADEPDLATPQPMVGHEQKQLESMDLARENLQVAKLVPGAENIDVDSHLATLDEWAAAVEKETIRHFYRFRQSPRDFENSEGYFRMLVLTTVLQQDFGVHYNPERVRSPDFSDPRDLFIHGILDGHGGTCLSLPVLYVAIGRRLGYPLHMVATKEHLFARWDGDGEVFNIECTSRGLVCHEDEYYLEWPSPITLRERHEENYLENMTGDMEVATFLMAAGHCLEAGGKRPAALVAYSRAHRLWPRPTSYQHLISLAAQSEESE